jgi:hypothetical protein
MAAIANAITEYTPFFTEFTGLLGKIGLTIISSKMAVNPLAPFKKGMLPLGTDIEELFVEMAKSEGAYDPNGANPMGRRKPSIKQLFHRENRKDKYVGSISRTQLKGAFFTEGGLDNLTNEIVNSLYSGDVYDEYVLTKQLLAEYEADYSNYEVRAIATGDDAKAFIKIVRKGIADLSYMSAANNKAGVKTRTEKESQVLIIHKDVLVEVDVEVLAKAFNMGKTDIQASIIEVDDFGDMADTYAILCDPDFVKIYDTEYATDTLYNPDGRFTNIFLHHHQIISTSQFKNAIRFTTKDVVQP